MSPEVLEILGRTLDIIGKVMIAFTAIMVHHRFLKEHKVDEMVFKIMRREQLVGVIGVVLMVVGFILEMLAKAV